MVCQEDLVNRYSVLSPDIERYGASLRGTVRVTDDIEAYAMFHYERSKVAYSGGQAIFARLRRPDRPVSATRHQATRPVSAACSEA